jgi:uracil-DNA glycosylase family 4
LPRASEAAAALQRLARTIETCESCARLRQYCRRIGAAKRAAFQTDTYWARPVPGFGDPHARIVIVGLAPAAHGANRTGRMFTGDGAGGSGDFLMTALHSNGLASQPHSRSADDGLTLRNVWLTAAVRCAPPDNKPLPSEIHTCRRHLDAELALLPSARVIVALGRIAFDSCWPVLADSRGRKPAFAHGAIARTAGDRCLLASYHPSRQNTHTGRLTPAMLASVFRRAIELAG